MDTAKRRFLFVSIDALISDIAWHVHREGNDNCMASSSGMSARHSASKAFRSITLKFRLL